MPESYGIDGRKEFRRDCAWWAYRRVSKLTNFRFQEMILDVEKVWKELENKAFSDQLAFEKKIVEMYKSNPDKARESLTKYSTDLANDAVDKYWELGDKLWSLYHNYF